MKTPLEKAFSETPFPEAFSGEVPGKAFSGEAPGKRVFQKRFLGGAQIWAKKAFVCNAFLGYISVFEGRGPVLRRSSNFRRPSRVRRVFRDGAPVSPRFSNSPRGSWARPVFERRSPVSLCSSNFSRALRSGELACISPYISQKRCFLSQKRAII